MHLDHVGALALTILFAVPAAATPVLVTFSGTVQSVDPALSSQFNTGEPVTGSFQYEPTTSDVQFADPTLGVYSGAIGATMSTATFQFGSYTGTGTTGSITIRLGPSSYRFQASNGNVSGPTVGSFLLTGMNLDLVDSSPSILSGDSLPSTLDLADFGQATALLFFDDGNGAVAVSAGVSTLSVTPVTNLPAVVVPEPAIFALLLAGLAALAGARRRHRL